MIADERQETTKAIAMMLKLHYAAMPSTSNTGDKVTDLARLLAATGEITAPFVSYSEIASSLTWLLIAARHPNLAGHVLESAVPRDLLDHLAVLADAVNQVYEELAL